MTHFIFMLISLYKPFSRGITTNGWMHSVRIKLFCDYLTAAMLAMTRKLLCSEHSSHCMLLQQLSWWLMLQRIPITVIFMFDKKCIDRKQSLSLFQPKERNWNDHCDRLILFLSFQSQNWFKCKEYIHFVESKPIINFTWGRKQPVVSRYVPNAKILCLETNTVQITDMSNYISYKLLVYFNISCSKSMMDFLFNGRLLIVILRWMDDENK